MRPQGTQGIGLQYVWPPGLLAPQAAGPPDGPDGLRTGLLASKTASQDGPPKASARASCRLHDNFLDEASVMTSVLIRRLCFPVDFGIRDNCLDDFLDETSVKRTVLQLHFTACQLTSVALCDGFTLVSYNRLFFSTLNFVFPRRLPQDLSKPNGLRNR